LSRAQIMKHIVRWKTRKSGGGREPHERSLADSKEEKTRTLQGTLGYSV
jgi:hypothetical protein